MSAVRWLVLRASYGGPYTVAHEASEFASMHRETGTLAGGFDRIRDANRRARELNREQGLSAAGARRGTSEARKPRGFMLASPEKRREYASKGGKAVQAAGKGKKFTREEARENGRKGGVAIVLLRGPEYMAAIGRRGGVASKKRAAERGAP